MAFIETRFPTTISYGSSGGFGHNTAIVEVRSGQETRTSRREVARLRWNANEAIKQDDEIAALIDFCRVMKGSAVGFRFLDHTDYSTGANHKGAPAADDVVFGYGDGVSTQFQLLKTYTVAGVTRTRNITKPIHGESVSVGEAAAISMDVLIAVAGTPTTSGWSVDTTTGMVTFTTAPTLGQELTWGGYFDVPCRFGIEVDDLLDIALQGYDDSEIPDVPIIELVDEGTVNEEYPYRGSKDHGPIAADASITLLGGAFQTFTPTTGGLKIILPDYTSIPTGVGHFVLANEGMNDMTVVNHLASTVATLTAGTALEFCLTLNGLGTKEWKAL